MAKQLVIVLTALLVLSQLYFSSFGVKASAAIGSTTVTLYSTADAYVNSSSPDTNYGSAISVNVSANSEQDFVYIMFDLSTIPPGASIMSANLSVYLSSTGGNIYSADRIGAYYCSDNTWSEQGISWNNKPSFSPNPTDSWSFGVSYFVGVYKSWNVTADVRTAQSSGLITEVLKFSSKTGDGYAVFQAREGANIPELEVEYSLSPSPSPTPLPTLTATPMPTFSSTPLPTPAGTSLPTATPPTPWYTFSPSPMLSPSPPSPQPSSPPPSPQATSSPKGPAGIPMMYVYAIVIAVVAALILSSVFGIRKRTSAR